ncbi:hypothetical protein [Moumouvirus maliensis]|nr:hypothetical protein [Moumouvirus maliensis]
MNKNIMDMSESDIKRYLATKNIPKNMKKQLETRLSILTQKNLYQILENMDENTENVNMVDSRKKKKNRKSRVEDKQTPDKKSEIVCEEDSKNINPSINYSHVAKTTDAQIQVPIGNNFVDGKLIIPYTEITKMYKYFAIYRIKMQHIILNRKMHILDSMQFVNYNKGVEFKNKLNYDKLYEDEYNCKKCIEVCMDLEELLDCCKSCINLMATSRKIQNNSGDFLELLKNAQNKYFSVKDIIFSFGDENLIKYKLRVIKYLDHLKYLLDNIHNINHQDILLLSSKTSIMFFEIEKLVDEIIDFYDVDVDCEYYAIISDKIENPIKPVAIRNIEFINCCDNISLNTNNINLDDYQLNTITIDEFNNLFNRYERDNNEDFIRIYQKTCQGLKCLNINFYLEHEINSPTIQIEISNLPENAYTITSIIHNYDLDDKYESVILPQSVNKYRWLENNKTESYFSMEDYESLDDYWKKLFSYEQLHNNKYILGHLFNCLSEMSNSIIDDDMFESFVNLSKNTSYLCDA